MSTVSEVCDTIGRRKLADALGVRPSAVSNAVVQNRFPAKWFKVVRSLAEEAGVECPDVLFSFITGEEDAAGARVA